MTQLIGTEMVTSSQQASFPSGALEELLQTHIHHSSQLTFLKLTWSLNSYIVQVEFCRSQFNFVSK
jgi:hypothetical protein